MRARLAAGLLAGVLLIAATRAPQLAGEASTPDGDEAVLGLQAIRLAEGREVPVFFPGQRYGLSLVEAGAAAVSFRVFGVSDLSLKAPPLALWSAAVLLVALAAARGGGPGAAAVAALLLILCPAWGRWSLKASGGYHTAFLAAGAALLLCLGPGRGAARAAAIGALAAIAFWAQALWLAGLAPFVLRFLVRGRAGKPAAALAGTALAGTGLLALVASAAPATWNPPSPALAHVPENLARLPSLAADLFGGAFFFARTLDDGVPIRLAAGVWIALTGAVLVAAVRPRPPGPATDVVRLSAVAVAATLAAVLLFPPGALFPRYLLPLPGFVALAAGVEAAGLLRLPRARPAVVAALGAVAITGALALSRIATLPFFSFPTARNVADRGATHELVDRLLALGVERVYCTDPLFQWSLMFASEERVLARWTAAPDRVPAYGRTVDEALRSGEPVALVGDLRDLPALEESLARGGWRGASPLPVGGLFYVLPGPSEGLLRALGFEIPRSVTRSPATP